MRGLRVGFQAVGAAAPGGVGLVRVRPGITQPVPVRRTPAQVPALLPGLDRHRGPHPDTRPGHLPLRRQPQHRHRLLVMLGGEVDPAARLRHPQLHAVMLEQRRHQRVLAAVERPLVLPDHDRVPAPVRVRQQGDQRGGLRAAAPRHRPALPGVEELRHDHAVPPGPAPRPAPAAAPATSPGPASPRSTPARRTRTATRRRAGPPGPPRPDASAHATRPSAPDDRAVACFPLRTAVMVATSWEEPHSTYLVSGTTNSLDFLRPAPVGSTPSPSGKEPAPNRRPTMPGPHVPKGGTGAFSSHHRRRHY